MKKNAIKLALGSSIAAGLALGTVAATATAENPFGMQTLESGYMQLASNEAKDKEGKCGEGKCGGKEGDKKKEGKCGEGKCGGKEGDKKHECKADSDKDGKVTKEEFLKHAEERFAAADANGDGVVEGDEMKNLHKHKKHKEGKCGEGKCGGKGKSDKEGKCGEGKCGGEGKSDKEGKCGEGKCGGDKKKDDK